MEHELEHAMEQCIAKGELDDDSIKDDEGTETGNKDQDTAMSSKNPDHEDVSEQPSGAHDDGEGTAPANLPDPLVKCHQCADKFPLHPPQTCEFAKTGTVTYSRFIDVPRRSGTVGQEKTREESSAAYRF